MLVSILFHNVRIRPLVQWSYSSVLLYNGLIPPSITKLSAGQASSTCHPEDAHTYLCKYKYSNFLYMSLSNDNS